MTIIELARLVKDCRDAQKTYFRDRTQYDLDRSKQFEREVDRAVRDVLGGASGQGSLLDRFAAGDAAGGEIPCSRLHPDAETTPVPPEEVG